MSEGTPSVKELETDRENSEENISEVSPHMHLITPISPKMMNCLAQGCPTI